MKTTKYHNSWTSIVLIVVFTYTAMSKLLDFNTYERQMLLHPLPDWINHTLVWLLPPVELVVAVLLLFPSKRFKGLVGSFILMTAFTLYIAAVLMGFFNTIPCSCGGILQSLSWEEHLGVNVILLAIASWGLLKENEMAFKT